MIKGSYLSLLLEHRNSSLKARELLVPSEHKAKSHSSVSMEQIYSQDRFLCRGSYSLEGNWAKRFDRA